MNHAAGTEVHRNLRAMGPRTTSSRIAPQRVSMPQHPYDSSKTRVVPVLEAISVTGPDWLRRLLSLPSHGASGATIPSDLDLRVEAQYWGAHERRLAPPPSLLEWLVRNLERAPAPKDQSDAAVRRRRLLDRDPATVTEALALLQTRPSGQAWHILEGHTYPDVFLETSDALVAIEGKRTEAGPTTSTTWMPVRHQMLRHMDAAWEARGDRRVYGFFIVEAAPVSRAVPPHWVQAAERTLAPTAVSGSLPHRSPAEREEIVQGCLGVTTWQAVCATFGLDLEILPDTIAPASA